MGLKYLNMDLGVRLFGMLALLFLFASCSDDQDGIYGDPVPVVFTPTIAGETEMEVSSRVVNNTWSGGETVGISSVGAGGSLATSATWYQYTAAAGGPSVTLTAPSPPLYYPVDGSNVNFFAFSPYKAPTSANLVTYSATDQSTQAKTEAVDFIWAKATGTHNKNAPNVSLAFTHRQSKVIVTVKPGTGVTDTDFGYSTATLTMSTMPCGATYKLSDGDLSGSITTGTITPWKKSSSTASVTWEAIVPPHSGATYTSRKLNFKFNGKSYSYSITDTYEAAHSYTYNLTLTTSGVTLNSTTVSNWTGGTTSWNGGKYVLHTTASELNFGPDASSQTLQIQYQGTDTPPTAQVSTKADKVEGTVSWLTATVASGTTTSTPWTQRTLTVKTTSPNTDTENLTGYIHVTLEGLSVVIKVTQACAVNQGDANCYIVAPGSTFELPLKRAVEEGEAPSNATFTVEKLWDDAGAVTIEGTPIGTGSNAKVKITGNLPGNAVIAAKVGDVIYWSWHIWVTDYNPNISNYTNTYNYNNGGSAHFVFMDRNLGATFAGVGGGYGTGLFYQWGRKDPFPATGKPGDTQLGGGKFTLSTGTGETDEATGVTVQYTIQHPNEFIKAGNNKNVNDWHKESRNNGLWGHGKGTLKSLYDPCPAGWRVPSHNVDVLSPGLETASPWYGFTKTNTVSPFSNGYSWGTNAAYPAAGLRYNANGELGRTGYTGAMWTASPNATNNAMNLYFNLDSATGNISLSINNSTYRANAMSVRCVKEKK